MDETREREIRDRGRMWHKIGKVLERLPQEEGRSMDIHSVVEILKQIVDICGRLSVQRENIEALARVMLKNGKLTIIAPCCPDYSHENGLYTFHEIGTDVSLLAQKHITFLAGVTKLIDAASVRFLIADHEADDPELCQVVKKTKEEFQAAVRKSTERTQEVVSRFGWTAEAMTAAIPDLLERERVASEMIRSSESLLRRIERETALRVEMYRKIRYSLTEDEMIGRTIKTAAQYMALGRWAYERDFMVCNHTTTSFSWFASVGTAVLHNPVAIY